MKDDPSDDPMGFRALRARWREAPAQEPPIPRDAAEADAFARALARDFDERLRDPDFAAFMEREAAHRLGATVAQVARWRRAFGATGR